MARVKDNKYYSIDGIRRPMSSYIYLGSDEALAMTWIDNGIKYAKVFKNDIAFHKWKKETEYMGPCKIERKHISRHGKGVIDVDTNSDIKDYYLEGNKYLLNRVSDSHTALDREIKRLEDSIQGMNAPWIEFPVRQKINELKQKKLETQKTIITIDETDIDAVDAKIAELEKNDPANPYLAKLLTISNRFWDN